MTAKQITPRLSVEQAADMIRTAMRVAAERGIPDGIEEILVALGGTPPGAVEEQMSCPYCGCATVEIDKRGKGQMVGTGPHPEKHWTRQCPECKLLFEAPPSSAREAAPDDAVFCAHCETTLRHCPACGKSEWRAGVSPLTKEQESDPAQAGAPIVPVTAREAAAAQADTEVLREAAAAFVKTLDEPVGSHRFLAPDRLRAVLSHPSPAREAAPERETAARPSESGARSYGATSAGDVSPSAAVPVETAGVVSGQSLVEWAARDAGAELRERLLAAKAGIERKPYMEWVTELRNVLDEAARALAPLPDAPEPQK